MAHSDDPFFDKGLPAAPDMERAVLGALLLRNEVCEEAKALLARDDFFLDSHRRIYDASIWLFEHGIPIELTSLEDELRKRGEFEQIGGATYISKLIDGVPATDFIEPYCKVIKRRSQARKRITAANQIIAENFEDPDDPELGSKAEARMSSLAMTEPDLAEPKPLLHYAEEAIYEANLARDSGDRITGIATGYYGFDGRTLGLQRQELTVIAARVSIGKTTLMTNMAHNIAKRGKENLIIWCGEAPGKRLAAKNLGKEGPVDTFRMRSGQYDQGAVYGALRSFDQWGMRYAMCDKPGIGVAEFRAMCRRHKMKYGLDVAFADYLTLFRFPSGFTDKRDAIGENAWQLKELARELDISMVLLHQLSRAPETRSSSDQRPRLPDLAESADVERHADVVVFLWRDRKPKRGEENITKAFVAKQRNGPPGQFGLVYIKSEDRFENLEDDRSLFMNDAPEGE